VCGPVRSALRRSSSSTTSGAEGDSDYSGELRVEGDDTSSTVTISLHTTFEGGDTDEDLEESLGNIRALVKSGPAPSA